MRDNTRSPWLLAASAAFLLNGCVSMEEFGCDMHETQTRGTKPQTTYELTEAKPGQPPARMLPAGSVPQVPVFSISFKPGYTKPCTTLTLHKNVVLMRSNDRDVVITEVREMYADDGTLIIPASQDITEQVMRSGHYLATTELPIPRNAPPGKYKVINKLIYEKRGDHRTNTTLARSEGYFYIIPLK
jgi:hypothetical protein